MKAKIILLGYLKDDIPEYDWQIVFNHIASARIIRAKNWGRRTYLLPYLNRLRKLGPLQKNTYKPT